MSTSFSWLLTSLDPLWSPERHWAGVSKKNWLPDFISAVHCVRWTGEKGFLNALSSRQKKDLAFRIRARNEVLRKKNVRLSQRELHLLARRVALGLAEHMGNVGSPKERLTWFREALTDRKFLRDSKKTAVSDECLDRLLGLNERKVRGLVQKKKNLPWSYKTEDSHFDLEVEDLFSPYYVLLHILKRLAPKPGERMVDLGAGVGRLGWVIAAFYPKNYFIGYELVLERVEQVERAHKALKLGNRFRFVCENLQTAHLPAGDIYYLFNPFSTKTLRRVFGELHRMAAHQRFRLVIVDIERAPVWAKKASWLREKTAYRFQDWDGDGYRVFQTSSEA